MKYNSRSFPVLCSNIQSAFSLIRLHVYLPLSFFITLVGLGVTNNVWQLKHLISISLANTFALVAAFIFNDIEDAQNDSRTQSPRNPIVLGHISLAIAYKMIIFACVFSFVLAATVSITVLCIAVIIVFITFLYSWQRFRIKEKPFWDIFTHGFTATLMFLSAAWSFEIVLERFIVTLGLAFLLGNGLSLVVHQLHEYQNDLVAEVKTTVITIGKKRTYWLILSTLVFIVMLVLNELRLGILPWQPILTFGGISGGLALGTALLFQQQVAYALKRVFPWSMNIGLIAAVMVWYSL